VTVAEKKGGGAKKGPAGGGRRTYYKIDGEKVTLTKPACPKCGPGIHLGTHADRKSCGKCGYTEFLKK
jgi:small subunit ribosomal protein S27Ae